MQKIQIEEFHDEVCSQFTNSNATDTTESCNTATDSTHSSNTRTSFDSSAPLSRSRAEEADCIVKSCALLEERLNRAARNHTRQKHVGREDKDQEAQRKLHSMRASLKDLYVQVLTISPSVALENRVMGLLWKYSIKSEINMCQKTIKTLRRRLEKEVRRHERGSKHMQRKTTETRGKWEHKINGVTALYARTLHSAKIFFTQLLSTLLKRCRLAQNGDGLFRDLLVTTKHHPVSDPMPTEVELLDMAPALKLAAECCLYLGDLSRYMLKLGPDVHDWINAPPGNYYRMATMFVRTDNTPHHRMAILASFEEDDLNAMYQYCRALGAKGTPFHKSKPNMHSLASKHVTRMRRNWRNAQPKNCDGSADKVKEIHGAVSVLAAIQTEKEARDAALWIFSELCKNKKVENMHVLVDVIMQKVSPLMMAPLSEIDCPDAEKHVETLFQLVVMSIYCVHNSLESQNRRQTWPARQNENGPTQHRETWPPRGNDPQQDQPDSDEPTVHSDALYWALSLFRELMVAATSGQSNVALTRLLPIIAIQAEWFSFHINFVTSTLGTSMTSTVFSALINLLNYIKDSKQMDIKFPQSVENAALLPEERDINGFMYINVRAVPLDPYAFFLERRTNKMLLEDGEHWVMNTHQEQLFRYCKLLHLAETLERSKGAITHKNGSWQITKDSNGNAWRTLDQAMNLAPQSTPRVQNGTPRNTELTPRSTDIQRPPHPIKYTLSLNQPNAPSNPLPQILDERTLMNLASKAAFSAASQALFDMKQLTEPSEQKSDSERLKLTDGPQNALSPVREERASSITSREERASANNIDNEHDNETSQPMTLLSLMQSMPPKQKTKARSRPEMSWPPRHECRLNDSSDDESSETNRSEPTRDAMSSQSTRGPSGETSSTHIRRSSVSSCSDGSSVYAATNPRSLNPELAGSVETPTRDFNDSFS